MSKARVVIELVYDLQDFYGHDFYKDVSDNDIHDDLEDTVYDSLIALMRSEKLRFWSEIQIEGDE